MREAGLENPPEADVLYRENIPEEELERKYTAFSIGLGTDRITLGRRLALAVHQRDIAERNLRAELERMRSDIHELWPLCTDRDSVEKVEKLGRGAARIAGCGGRVSCAAEGLGATRQEERISRAVLTADRYLQLLRARCENLAAELAETKRILLKNNIVLEENTNEMGEDLPRIRYRTTAPPGNRMIARRRASIATISRPLISPQDAKDPPRQRNSVSGRVTIRRPSFSAEPMRWEPERVHRSDSSGTVAELRDISEQTESRKGSHEENNNLTPIIAHAHQPQEHPDASWTSPGCTAQSVDSGDTEPRRRKSTDSSFPGEISTWRPILRCLGIFVLGFLTNELVTGLGDD